ncbi:OsmC family protein [Streptomyces sp. NPDC046831]|uniref:OsmC family protein n=1 Tax=Streptomyces sp. NPDC046831 TaxID=3154805 RepID=UPI0033E214D4
MNIHTRCGRVIGVTRFAPRGLPPAMDRVVLETSTTPQDKGGELWASMTPEEARRLAGLLLYQADAVQPAPAAPPGEVEVRPVAGDACAIRVRGHVLTVDLPQSDGGSDTAPTPVELYVSSVAAGVAQHAGRYLDRHGLDREGLRVSARFRTAADRPAQVAGIELTVAAPSLPEDRIPAFRDVVAQGAPGTTPARPPRTSLEVRIGAHGTPVPAPERSPA